MRAAAFLPYSSQRQKSRFRPGVPPAWPDKPAAAGALPIRQAARKQTSGTPSAKNRSYPAK